MKKHLIILFFWVFILSNAFADDDEKRIVSEQKTARISVSGGINLSSYFMIPMNPGLSVEYERLLGKLFSVGIEIGTMWFYTPYFEILGRIYPFSGMFFGLGWGLWLATPEYLNYYHMVFAEFGWKINIKKNTKWHLTPSVAVKMIQPEIKDNNVWKKNSLVMEMLLPELNFKFGYKF